jgi:Rod binding domain-containing protein
MKITAANALEMLKSNAAAPLKPLDSGEFARQLEAQSAAAVDAESARPHSSLRPLTPLEMMPGIKGPPKPLAPLAPAATPLLPLGTSPFDLGKSKPPKSEHDKVQEQARKWLAQTFYGPMLKQMRESPFKSEMFSGGRGGQAFASMLDQRLADHMSRATDSKLVASITRKLMANKGAAPRPAPPPTQRGQSPAPASTPSSSNPYENVRIHVAPNLRA